METAIKGRKKKVRYVQKMPEIAQFSPRGKAGRPDEVELTVDQFEAVRLGDFQGFDQSEGAVAMGISRPSFGRILREARKIIADALVNGKIIRIRTGNVQVGVRPLNLESVEPIQKQRLNEEQIRKKMLKINPAK